MARAEINTDLYFNWRRLDGYPQPFKFAMGAREPGKTTNSWIKIWRRFSATGKPWINLVRQAVVINDAYIESIRGNITKFFDDVPEFTYTKGEFKTGIVDIKVENKIFIRIVSLNIPLQRIKLCVLQDLDGVFFDEYIINPRNGEKYLANEGFKIKEAYTTWRREANGILNFYFVGNPYSLYNPLFVELGVSVNELRKGEVWTNELIAVEWVVLTEGLKAKLLKENPLYKFDEDYSDYAMEGTAINDRNIKLGQQPQNFSLKFIFKASNKYIGVFKNNVYTEDSDRFYCKFITDFSKYRTIYCYEFEELVERAIVMSLDERMRLQRFKEAFRERKIAFENINCYYFCEEIYKNI